MPSLGRRYNAYTAAILAGFKSPPPVIRNTRPEMIPGRAALLGNGFCCAVAIIKNPNSKTDATALIVCIEASLLLSLILRFQVQTFSTSYAGVVPCGS
ncbi:hypothetical protein SBA5_120073 [Candidatus Sulfotelmatomonas gaucii]|uniref:Uncharacterized protein n=1 Tax=Candidatus Sulfuritelmatomonas gaucii TaxID=2043161 RepID=A0A2N9L3U2_9BACT|nr:hypothetical protein SBA5_120073 [Candidatus Sulfotelmatomonas gaucii]